MTIGFVTYGSISPAIENGTHGGKNKAKAHVLQGIPQNVTRNSPTKENWCLRFTAMANRLDGIVVHVGTVRFDHILSELAKYDPENVIILTCGCKDAEKRECFKSFGLENVRVIRCMCGGSKEMGRILRKFLRNGKI